MANVLAVGRGQSWIERYPIVSLEDGLAENDWSGFQKLTKLIGDRVQIVGDDIYVTNAEFIRKGIGLRATNAVLIKLNHIGTVTETIDALACPGGCIIALRRKALLSSGLFLRSLASLAVWKIEAGHSALTVTLKRQRVRVGLRCATDLSCDEVADGATFLNEVAREAVVDPLRLPPRGNQPDVAQALEVLRHTGLRDTEQVLDLANAKIAVIEEANDPQSGQIGQCFENRDHLGRISICRMCVRSHPTFPLVMT